MENQEKPNELLENNKKPENPPAFPDLAVIKSGDNFTQQIRQSGMTLRDYFAAKAMNGLISSDKDWSFNPEHLSNRSYVIADAMLKQREL